jgi:dynein heavy chain
VIPYKNVTEAYILGNNEDMITRLDDTLLTLSNILASRFVEGIRPRVETQVRMFRHLQELLDEWAIHQTNYIYLEPILSTNASQMGLQKESSKFKTAEKSWRNIMKRCKENPFCRNWAEESVNRTYFQQLKNNNANFEIIQKALDDYLEKKREHFQRFPAYVGSSSSPTTSCWRS